ncbi:hypothetical protein Y032_0048g1603 [Ancylostoma ceylanicum]|uniref:Uncharacterized protein n=1 Tax=Ancylostoma ceylanicum TaxID=53326 RepID=A0A016UBX5_9BILA|nr:hypothetical protein Y032_0048g1603 [Ancylostoma ceylanicum]
MAVTHPRPRQRRHATAPHAPESLSSAVGVLFLGGFLPNLVTFSLFLCFITRSSIMAASDIDSVARGAVAWRACEGRGWVSANDAHCSGSLKVVHKQLVFLNGTVCADESLWATIAGNPESEYFFLGSID